MNLLIASQKNHYKDIRHIRFHSIYTNEPVFIEATIAPIRAVQKMRIDYDSMEGTELITRNGSHILICSDTVLFKSVLEVVVPESPVDKIWSSLVENYGDTIADIPMKEMRSKEQLKMILDSFLL